MTRSRHEFETVRRLVAIGHNDCEIARRTGIPRETVRDWRSGARDRTQRDSKSGDCASVGNHDFAALPAKQYAYLLGIYLGDGCISRHPRGVWKLRITCDSQYPKIIAECSSAIEAMMPDQHAYLLKRKSRCVEISMYSKHWPCFFPQSGPGRSGRSTRPVHRVQGVDAVSDGSRCGWV